MDQDEISNVKEKLKFAIEIKLSNSSFFVRHVISPR